MLRLGAGIVIGTLWFATNGAMAEPAPEPTPSPEASPAAEASPAVAATPTPDAAPVPSGAAPALADLEVHGFVSPGFLMTTHGVDYLAHTGDRGSFEFSEVGINFTKQIDDRLRVGMQLFARDLGPAGSGYAEKADWFYLDYRWRDWLGVRAGRVKLPVGLYNAASDVDAARAPVLLPQSVYPIANRDYLLAQTGAEAYGYRRVPLLGALEYRAYAGTISLETPPPVPGSPIQISEITVPYIAGGRLMLEPLDGLRIGASAESLRIDAQYLFTAPAPAAVDVEIPVLIWVASAEYVRGPLLLASEYSQWAAEIESSNAALVPDTRVVNERYYALAAFQVTDRFQTALYHSVFYPDISKREWPEDWQHDTSLTLRFDATEHWLVKVEGHLMNGTAAITNSLNPDTTVADRPERWGVFLVKTTAHF